MPRPGRTGRVAEAVAARGFTHIGEEEWRQLMADLAPVTEDWLRRAVRNCGLPLSPLVEGVRVSSLEQTERTAMALAGEYVVAIACGDSKRAAQCRRLVLSAKGRARLAAASARDPARRAEKEEIARWLLVWLENPDLFASWIALRKMQLQ